MAKKMKKEAKVLSQKLLADGIYDMWLETPFAGDVKPGQFVGVYPVSSSSPAQIRPNSSETSKAGTVLLQNISITKSRVN